MMASLAKEEVLLDGMRVVCYRGGRGTPLFLVHGITTYSFIWRKLIPALMEQHQVVVLDLPGCGDSDKPLDVSYSLRNHATRLLKLLDLLV